MKYFFPLLMALVILAGVSLIVTPFIAEYIFPASKTTLRAADPKEATQALADWFGVPPSNLSGVQAIKQVATQGNTSWFTFTLERTPVEHFIVQNQLKQQALTPDLLQNTFMAQTPPIAWWQPAQLQRETCFIGKVEEREMGLIYDAERKVGFLILRTYVKPAKF